MYSVYHLCKMERIWTSLYTTETLLSERKGNVSWDQDPGWREIFSLYTLLFLCALGHLKVVYL